MASFLRTLLLANAALGQAFTRFAASTFVLVLLVGGAAHAQQTALWYTLVPAPGSGVPPVTRLYEPPANGFVFNNKSPGGLFVAVDTGSGGSATLEMDPPRGQVFATGAYEQTVFPLVRVATGGLSLFPTIDSNCSDEGRFVVLELAYDSNFDMVAFAADFEIRCRSGAVFYGELRYNSAMPLTIDKAPTAATPDAFAFFPATMLRPGTSVTSNPVTIYGMRAAAPMSIVGGEYSLNGAAFTSAPGIASSRDRVVVRQSTSPSYGVTTSTTLTVGGVSAQFDATTFTPGVPFTALTMQSETPNLFFGTSSTFEARPPDWPFMVPATAADVLRFVVGSSGPMFVVISFAAPPGQTLVAGPYEAAAWAPFRGASPGLEVSSCTPSTGRFVVHEIAWNADGTLDRFAASFEQWCFGSVGPIFGDIRYNSAVPLPSMAVEPRSTPYAFALNAQSPVRAGALVRSNLITIDGIDVPVPISITGGEYSVNGGPFTSAPGMANPRDDVVVQLVASRTPGGMRSATFTAGGRSATLSARTYQPGMLLSGLYFQSTSGDYIGAGSTRLMLAPPNIVTPARSFGGEADMHVDAEGGTLWNAVMVGPGGARPVAGTYENATRWPPQATTDPGFDFSGDGRGCNQLFARFVVQEAQYAPDGTLQRFSADFEQHCEQATAPPLYGEVRFNSTVPFSALVGGTCTSNDPACVADLSVTQSGSAATILGQDVALTLSVTNQGPATAHNVTVVDTLPGNAQLVSAPAGCAVAATTIRCLAASLASGATLTFDLTLRPSAIGAMTNAVNVVAEEFDLVPANNDHAMSVQIVAPPHMVNLATRGPVLTGNDVMIGGFVIGGATSKTVVVTALGPSLAAAGIGNALVDPMVTLVRSSDGTALATNNDWASAPNAPAIQAAGFAPAHPRESAIMMTLPPGAYTAIVSGADGGTGVGIVAVYEVDHPEVPLVNISTRGRVLTGNDVMIGGFIVQGTAPQTVVVTGIGPSLAPAGIPNPLANPTLTLVRSSDQSIVATNDDWGGAPNASAIQAAGFAPANALESAIMVTLPPGAYTTILSGAGGATGVGIVAVYAVP